MNFAVDNPKPAASAATVGTAISATSGESRFVMIRPNSATIAIVPVSASIRRPPSASD
jgi:hypothetical protein